MFQSLPPGSDSGLRRTARCVVAIHTLTEVIRKVVDRQR